MHYNIENTQWIENNNHNAFFNETNELTTTQTAKRVFFCEETSIYFIYNNFVQ